MAAAGLSDKFHSTELVKRPHGILKPIDKNELSTNKRVKYKVTDPLVAPVEKVDVPDHLLNTSKPTTFLASMATSFFDELWWFLPRNLRQAAAESNVRSCSR